MLVETGYKQWYVYINFHKGSEDPSIWNFLLSVEGLIDISLWLLHYQQSARREKVLSCRFAAESNVLQDEDAAQ